MTPVPENAIEVVGNLVAFVDGKYICLRKTYVAEDGQRALGRGMNLLREQFETLVGMSEKLLGEVSE
jgi:hypothetical protein